MLPVVSGTHTWSWKLSCVDGKGCCYVWAYCQLTHQGRQQTVEEAQRICVPRPIPGATLPQVTLSHWGMGMGSWKWLGCLLLLVSGSHWGVSWMSTYGGKQGGRSLWGLVSSLTRNLGAAQWTAVHSLGFPNSLLCRLSFELPSTTFQFHSAYMVLIWFSAMVLSSRLREDCKKLCHFVQWGPLTQDHITKALWTGLFSMLVCILLVITLFYQV